jgi:hypothetical protein
MILYFSFLRFSQFSLRNVFSFLFHLVPEGLPSDGAIAQHFAEGVREQHVEWTKFVYSLLPIPAAAKKFKPQLGEFEAHLQRQVSYCQQLQGHEK